MEMAEVISKYGYGLVDANHRVLPVGYKGSIQKTKKHLCQMRPCVSCLKRLVQAGIIEEGIRKEKNVSFISNG